MNMFPWHSPYIFNVLLAGNSFAELNWKICKRKNYIVTSSLNLRMRKWKVQFSRQIHRTCQPLRKSQKIRTSIIRKMRQYLKFVNYLTPANLVTGILIVGNKQIALMFWRFIRKIPWFRSEFLFMVSSNILLPKYYVSSTIHRGNSKVSKKAEYEKKRIIKKLRHATKFRRMFIDYHWRICTTEFI